MASEQRIASYPSIFNVGHKGMSALAHVRVNVEEKIDGSQFSFGVIDGQLSVRSKGVEFMPEAAPDLFRPACDTAMRLFAEGKLENNVVYRCETLKKPKHNAIGYERVPRDHVMVFDVDVNGNPVQVEDRLRFCEKAGLEAVPVLAFGVPFLDIDFGAFLSTPSILGGEIEGVVVKPTGYDIFGPDKKLVVAKFVRSDFKEINEKAWSRGGEHRNHTRNDILLKLSERYRTEARWTKAIQHLAEAGKLEGSPRDIRLLIDEVPNDILAECEAEISSALLSWAMRDLRKLWVKGLAEFYKAKLADSQIHNFTDN